MEGVPRNANASTDAALSVAADFRGVFDAAPVSLWVEDYGGIRALLDELRARGIDDLGSYLATDPAFVERAMAAIRVVDVNDATLALFRAPDKAALLARLADVFRGDMRAHFAAELVQM